MFKTYFVKENTLTLLIFLIFWTFCFLNGFFNPELAKNLPLFYAVEILFWVIIPFISIYYITKIAKFFTFSELGFQLEIFKKRNYFILIIFSLVFGYLIQSVYFNIILFYQKSFQLIISNILIMKRLFRIPF